MTDIAWTVRTLKAALDGTAAVAAGEFSLRVVEGAGTGLCPRAGPLGVWHGMDRP